MSQLHIRWPKYCSFNFSISPSNEYSGLISFRMDWLDLLAVQGTLKSLLQHCSSKVSILQHSAFFTVQLSHPYMITGKTIALTRWTFVDKAMSLLFNMLSRLVITFLPRTICLLIPWLPSLSAVILEHSCDHIADFLVNCCLLLFSLRGNWRLGSINTDGIKLLNGNSQLRWYCSLEGILEMCVVVCVGC